MNSIAGCFCPNCNIENPPGSRVCAFCAHLLEEEGRPATCLDTPVDSNCRLLLFVPGVEKPLQIDAGRTIILGRDLDQAQGGQGEVILDLSPFQALESGVSRRHALVRPVENGFELSDMGSTNGTWLNQSRIVPGQGYRLSGNSEIHLGRMLLYLVVRDPRGATHALAE